MTFVRLELAAVLFVNTWGDAEVAEAKHIPLEMFLQAIRRAN